MNRKGTVVWICGLPGSGKSTIAKILLTRFREDLGRRFEYVSMDELRKKIVPEPTYDDKERDCAYRSIVQIARFLAQNGVDVLVDATAHRRIWRDLARSEIGRNYIEVYVECPVEVCIERETRREEKCSVRSKLYEEALLRLRSGKTFSGLGKVPGVDEPFEESKSEIVVDSLRYSPDQAANLILDRIRNSD